VITAKKKKIVPYKKDKEEKNDDPKIDLWLLRSKYLDEFINNLKKKGRTGLYKEYEESIETKRHPKPLTNQVSEIIHAHFVDGINEPKAYIVSEGPSSKTIVDEFWKMVWDEKVMVIVNLKNTIEHGIKTTQYWPKYGKSMVSTPDKYHKFHISAKYVKNHGNYIETIIEFRNELSQEIRTVIHFQYTMWPEFGAPKSANSVLKFWQNIHEKQEELINAQKEFAKLNNAKWNGPKSGRPPIVIHCRAGIGRTGTFTAIDLVINEFEFSNKINIHNTVEKLRSQRRYSVETRGQYEFIHRAFLQYALNKGYIKEYPKDIFD